MLADAARARWAARLVDVADGVRRFEGGDVAGGLAAHEAATARILTELDFDPLGRAVAGSRLQGGHLPARPEDARRFPERRGRVDEVLEDPLEAAGVEAAVGGVNVLGAAHVELHRQAAPGGAAPGLRDHRQAGVHAGNPPLRRHRRSDGERVVAGAAAHVEHPAAGADAQLGQQQAVDRLEQLQVPMRVQVADQRRHVVAAVGVGEGGRAAHRAACARACSRSRSISSRRSTLPVGLRGTRSVTATSRTCFQGARRPWSHARSSPGSTGARSAT